jgi:hypothetical protein
LTGRNQPPSFGGKTDVRQTLSPIRASTLTDPKPRRLPSSKRRSSSCAVRASPAAPPILT